MTIRAIIFGATGMVGEGVLHQALSNPEVESVLVIGRKTCRVENSKLKEIILQDFSDYSFIENQLMGYNACFFCLGVSSIVMKEEDYTKITFDLTMTAAKTLARINNDMTFCYVSGAGTDSTEKGKLMWARVKGRTENELQKLQFKSVYLFRPGYIKPIKGLKNSFRISRLISPFYPVLKFIFPRHVCTLADLGTAMINVSANGYSKKILENLDIEIISKNS